MQNNITNFDKCANCGACANVCSQNAINLDTNGYFYKYTVDSDKCVQCGMCVKVCPLNNLNPYLDLKGAYGGWHRDKNIVKLSSSGGAFSAIAEYVLSNRGIVFGAAYEDDFKSVTIKSTEETTLDNIRRSKYVESAVAFAFRSIKSELKSGRLVLFCGTPCQVAGLKSYLQQEYENLITVDFACGGLTSHKIYADYMHSLEKKYRDNISSVNFRAGLYGWKNHSLVVKFSNNKVYKIPSEIDPYVFSFMYSRCGNRENCFDCKFRNNHHSDFIIADFWRWFEYSNLKNDETGISLILTNSDKAEALIPELKKIMCLEKLDINQAKYNCFIKPPVNANIMNKRKQFFDDYEKYGLRQAALNSGMLHGLRAWILKLRLKSNVKRIGK